MLASICVYAQLGRATSLCGFPSYLRLPGTLFRKTPPPPTLRRSRPQKHRRENILASAKLAPGIFRSSCQTPQSDFRGSHRTTGVMPRRRIGGDLPDVGINSSEVLWTHHRKISVVLIVCDDLVDVWARRGKRFEDLEFPGANVQTHLRVCPGVVTTHPAFDVSRLSRGARIVDISVGR